MKVTVHSKNWMLKLSGVYVNWKLEVFFTLKDSVPVTIMRGLCNKPKNASEAYSNSRFLSNQVENSKWAIIKRNCGQLRWREENSNCGKPRPPTEQAFSSIWHLLQDSPSDDDRIGTSAQFFCVFCYYISVIGILATAFLWICFFKKIKLI